MSPRMKAHLLSFAALPPGWFAFVLLGVLLHPAIAMLGFPYLVAIVLLATSIRCPSCHTRVTLHRYNTLGIRYTADCPYVQRLCEQCGYDLSRREKRAEGQ
jgi:hypothetical protein